MATGSIFSGTFQRYGTAGEPNVLVASDNAGGVQHVNGTFTGSLSYVGPLYVTGNVTYTANTAIGGTERIILTSGTVTLTLPNPAAYPKREITIIKTDTGTTTSVAPFGAELVNGVNAAKTIATQWSRTTFWNDGTNWYAA